MMALGCMLLVFITFSQMAAWASPIDEKIVTPTFTSVIEVSTQSSTRIKTDLKFRKSHSVAQYNVTTDPEYDLHVKCSLTLACTEFSLAVFLGDKYDVKKYGCSESSGPVLTTFTASSSKMYLLFYSGFTSGADYDCTLYTSKSAAPPSTTTSTTTEPASTTTSTTTAPSSLLTRKPDYHEAKKLKEGERFSIQTIKGFSAERYLAQYDLSTDSDDLGLTVDCKLRLSCADISIALFVSPLPQVSRYDCNLDKEPITVSASSFGRFMTLFFHSGYSTSGQYDCLVKTRKIDPHETTTTTKTTTTTTTSKPYGCQCGESSVNKIINGSPVQLGEIPWQVGVQSKTDGIWETFCGGSLVSDRFVVTARHCVWSLSAGEIRVQLGVIRRDEVGVIVTVRDIITPSTYSTVSYDSDIAIFKLTRVVDFTKNIFPVCVPPKVSKETFAGRTMTVSGWGSINTNGDKSPVLLKTEVVGMTDEECRKIYGKDKLTSNMMCARKQGTDACKGDSGGPLTYKDKNGISFLTGVVSWGEGCSDKPGVYVRMTEAMAWFNSKTEDSVCTIYWRL